MAVISLKGAQHFLIYFAPGLEKMSSAKVGTENQSVVQGKSAKSVLYTK
jgi:hypothetical protein